MSDRMAEIMNRLNREGNDDHAIEAKAGSGKLDKGFWSTVSAFANTNGGTIVLGVNDDQRTRSFTVDPSFDVHKVNDQLISEFRSEQEKPPTTPIPRHNIETDEFEGNPVVLVEIFPMRGDSQLEKRMPCYVTAQGPKKGSYKRVLDGDQHLSPYEIDQLSAMFDPDYSEIEAIHQADLSDLDERSWKDLTSSLTKSGSRIMYGTSTDAEVLARLHIVNGDNVPVMAGLLTVGKYPQQFFPQLFIDVAVHPTFEKSAQATRFVDRKHCDGPLPVAVEDAVQAVLRNLRTRTVESGGTMVDEPEIPEIVLREAITNAVMHRDYSAAARGMQVHVDVYPDRVEVINPGGLWRGLTVDQLYEGRSESRNPYIASLLSHLPTPNGSSHVAENHGSGIQRMLQGMREKGLPSPEFHAEIGEFRVTLQRFGLLTPDLAEWLEQRAPNASRDRHVALAIARGLGAVTPRELRKNLGMDSDDARSLFRTMVDEGLLATTPDVDRFVLAGTEPPAPPESTPLDASERRVLEILSPTEALSAREVADRVGLSVNTVRVKLRSLLDANLILATAPPTSRARKYLRVADAP
ncbi:ATP-binding protein [Corynebacterium gottingense]|uniref:ATP-binding protein n=1 Tax=Corynebacterium gottingense TaxID=2041036 RepID=UPI0038D199C7